MGEEGGQYREGIQEMMQTRRREVERGDNSGGRMGRSRERKRRHIGNNEGEGYVCVALSA